MSNSKTIGRALIWLSISIYLLTLESVRLANHFWSKFLLASPSIFGLVCIVCALLIALGLPLCFLSQKAINAVALVFLAIATLMLGVPALVYLPFFIPYASGDTYSFADWVVVLVLVGIASFSFCMSASYLLRLRKGAGLTNRSSEQPPTTSAQ